jgi:hypothetical protein
MIGFVPNYSGFFFIKLVTSSGQNFRLAVFSERHAILADWEGIFALLKEHFPEQVWQMVHRVASELIATPFREIELQSPLGLSFFEINEAGLASPHFMSEARLLESGGALWEVRLFLYNCLGMSALYSGTGYTQGPDGQPTVREYLMPNVPVSQIDGLRLLPLNVALSDIGD